MVMSIYMFMFARGIDIIVLLICLSEARRTVGAIAGQMSHLVAVVALVVVLAAAFRAFAGKVAELAAVEALVLAFLLLL